ncbi:unnamed protein product [Auanema sp. JU1783]|nr:unnamed protein product [Auanema sp. JU1783]
MVKMNKCLLFLTIFLGTSAAEQFTGRCESLSCATREELVDIITGLQKEVSTNDIRGASVNFWSGNSEELAVTAAPVCNICASTPCFNGGTCIADINKPFAKYYCVCPANYGGSNCQKEIKCTDKSCGTGASCFVSNHQVNCICPVGSSGNPLKSCNYKTVQACVNGDPHYTTYDGLYYDYQGTCPYDFTYPCNNQSLFSFRVVGKNHQIYNGVSTPAEVEVTFFGQNIHVDARNNRLFINGILTNVPYYWPSKSATKYSVKYYAGAFQIVSNQMISVSMSYGRMCVSVPQSLKGSDVLCGIAGNFDNDYKNDVRYKNGTVYTLNSRHEPTNKDALVFNRALDTWITTDFLKTAGTDPHCINGETIYNNSNCDNLDAQRKCEPIQLAATAEGPLAACSAMTADVINNYYSDCVFDVCHETDLCSVLTNFARICQGLVPNADLSTWRASTNCAPKCPSNSYYSSCTSACPATCADQDAPDFCDAPCVDGCVCNTGYVLDNTALDTPTCVRAEKCGCSDPYGNFHPANQPWYVGNCSIIAECVNGTYDSRINECSQYGQCAILGGGKLGCSCKSGFTGDGYNCTDINECLDPYTCGANTGNGICTNTIGSYNCTCNPYYSGANCEHYYPQRHCADLYMYNGVTASGVYTIYPPYSINGNPPSSPVQVYCDMDITYNNAKGGWTLMSHDTADLMANKSLNSYKAGFGDAKTKNLWLGLDFIHKMTSSIDTSLYVNLFHCSENGKPSEYRFCNYRLFTVNDEGSNYTVNIPETCQGTASDFKDGWARWKLSEPGPPFLAYDKDTSPYSCSSTFRNTGFWFDTTIRCGSADLNGVRFSCDNIPDDSSESSYLYWNGSPIGDAWMYLRPSAYPTYDRAPTGSF